jgi:protein gp37
VNKTKIEWADYTWNPIKGLCPEACWYCYARAMYRRFKMDPKLRLDYKELIEPMFYDGPGRIFVGSTMELFHPRIAERWRTRIFEVIASLPGLTFIILTKRPERIDRAMPDNVWLGVSCDGSDWERDDARISVLEQMTKAKVRFISYEPLLGSPRYWGHWRGGRMDRVHWIIAGKLTGRRPRDIGSFPSYDVMVRGHVETLVALAHRDGIPIFLKDNLKGIWPGPLIQEFPR